MPTRLLNTLVMCLALVFMSACQSGVTMVSTNSNSLIPLNFLPAISGDYFEFESRTIDQSYHIYVRFPEDYNKNLDEKYPVVYLLDGDSLFPILAASHLFLTYDEGLPEAIIVGIAYGSFDPKKNKRGFDFSGPAEDARSEQGGAPAFQNFLKSELIPEVERRYQADTSRRILFGQSRGGYMVLYSAFTDPDVFWGHIASNPSFDPGRDRFFSDPAPSTRSDLGLVVTSGSRDRKYLREPALLWFKAWGNLSDTPWELHTMTIDKGTHSADSTRSYREAMLWLFGRN